MSPGVPGFTERLRQAQALQDRFEQSGEITDLNEALRIYQRLLRDPALARESASTYLLAANDYANTCLRHYQVGSDRSDLERAIRLWRRAIRASLENEPALPAY